MLICQLMLRVALADSTTAGYEEVYGCINEAVAASKKNFAVALKTVKKPPAKEALKSYHVALIGALEGVKPGAEERKLTYEARQSALQGKLTDAWTRFEIEQ